MFVTDRNDPRLAEGQKNEAGQHSVYLVMSQEERAKGFIRPVRNTYIHVGKATEAGKIVPIENYPNSFYTKANGYVAFLEYGEERDPVVGRYIQQDELDAFLSNRKYFGGCDSRTTMGKELSETYAVNPKFYGKTFCTHCNSHLPVDEFIWEDGETVGS